MTSRDTPSPRAAMDQPRDSLSAPHAGIDAVLHRLQKPLQIDPSAFVAASATLIGDVEVGRGSSVWFAAVLRGDVGSIRIGQNSNVQDGCILHTSTDGPPCLLGDYCTVGHGAILHSCRLDNYAFVGFGARVLDGCHIASDGVLAAGAVLPPGKAVSSGELWAGNPARLLRILAPDEIERHRLVATRYVQLSRAYMQSIARPG